MSADAADPTLDTPENPETEVFVCVSGIGPARRYHQAPPRIDAPPCWQGGGHDPTWERRRLGSLSAESQPCKRCYTADPGAWAAGTNDDHDGQPCPLCGAEGVSLAPHLATPEGRGCPVTPQNGGDTSR